jgi:hypothetical protein
MLYFFEPVPFTTRSHEETARAARRELEAALDAAGWPWSRRLSHWIDALVVIAEHGQ